MERLSFSYGQNNMNYGFDGSCSQSNVPSNVSAVEHRNAFISQHSQNGDGRNAYSNLYRMESNDGLQKSFDLSLGFTGVSPYNTQPLGRAQEKSIKDEYGLSSEQKTMRNAFSSQDQNGGDIEDLGRNNSYEMFKQVLDTGRYSFPPHDVLNRVAVKAEKTAFGKLEEDLRQPNLVNKSAFMAMEDPTNRVNTLRETNSNENFSPNYSYYSDHQEYTSGKETEALYEKMNRLSFQPPENNPLNSSPLLMSNVETEFQMGRVRQIKPDVGARAYQTASTKCRKMNDVDTPGLHCAPSQPVGSFGMKPVVQLYPEQELDNGHRRKWSEYEDELLRQAVHVNGEKNWKAIADMVQGRNHVQCLQRWKKVLKPGLIKGHWTEEEDALLKQVVNDGFRNWGDVAQKIQGRTAKQCRERWSCNLDPNINREKWTEEEDAKIIAAQQQLGNKWSTIAQLLPGRTENAIKTRAKSLQRKELKKWTQKEDDLIIKYKTTQKKTEGETEVGITRSSAWAKIANELPGRSKNAVKKRWKELKEELFSEVRG